MGELIMNMNKKVNSSPCLHCENRSLGCHSTCSEYRKYKFVNNFYSSKERNRKLKTQEYISFRRDALDKRSKAQNTRWAKGV